MRLTYRQYFERKDIRGRLEFYGRIQPQVLDSQLGEDEAGPFVLYTADSGNLEVQ